MAGKPLSVTAALGLAGIADQRWCDEEARARGTAVHEACADDDRDTLDLRKIRPGVRKYVYAWRQAKSDLRIPSFSHIEWELENKIYGYSGRPDRLVIWPEKAAVIDLKSGEVPAWTRLQLAGYAFAWRGIELTTRIAVQLKPKSDPPYSVIIYEIDSLIEDINDFLAAVRVARFRQRHNLA